MLRRTFRRLETHHATSARPTAEEAPFLLEGDGPKAFVDPSMLRSFTAAFLVGAFGVASLYWLMSHKVTNEAMHRRRFIYTLARDEAEAAFGCAARRRRNDPYDQFVSPSCARYQDLLEQLQRKSSEEGDDTSEEKKLDTTRLRRPSTVLSDAYHSSLLHETAVDSVKVMWNGCVENLQDALRSAMASWVEMRERDTIAAVQEMARSTVGENAVAVKTGERNA